MRLTRAPYMRRLSMSRPSRSVPSQKCRLGATGWPLAVMPLSNCVSGLCGASQGAKTATMTSRTTTTRPLTANLSLRKRRQTWLQVRSVSMISVSGSHSP